MGARVDRIKSILTRETSGGRFVPEIDGLRFFAVASVFVYHVNGFLLAKSDGRFRPIEASGLPPAQLPEAVAKNPAALELAKDVFSRICAEGYFGVQLFFAISGLILALPFADHFLASSPNVSLKKYFTRRVLRLEPPYIINLLFCAALAIVLWPMPIAELIKHWLASATYTHFLWYGEGSAINSVAWSLEIEVQFYILAPFLAFVFAIPATILRRSVIVGAIGGFAFLQRFFDHGGYQPTIGFTIAHQLHWFLVGFLLADLYVTDWRRNPTKGSLAWDAIAIAAGVAMWWLLAYRIEIHFTLPIAMFLLYAGGFRGRLLPRFLRQPPIYIIGGMCYTIYLYHFVLVTALGRLTMKIAPSGSFAVHLAIQIVLLAIPILIMSAVLFALFEKPFMIRDWPARLRAFVRARLGRRAAST